MEEQQLAKVRAEIDSIDQQIHTLLNKRAYCAQQVAEIKLAALSEDQKHKAEFYRPEREAQVLSKVMERNKGPLDDKTIARLFREIMSVCLALEEQLQVAVLGPSGTFTEAAALKHFGQAVAIVPVNGFEDIFREVEVGNCHYGVIPVENSTEGGINFTLDRLVNTSVKICGEVTLPVHHHLLATTNMELADIICVYSHQQSLAQCRQWLQTYLPHAKQIALNSNSEAAQRVEKALQEGEKVAAIAGERAAQKYQLPILKKNIEDNIQNSTRFLILGNDMVSESGNDKTSLVLSIQNRPGALYALLAILADQNISMSRIESRPAGNNLGDYFFFIDLDGHQNDTLINAALEKLRQQTRFFKVLGSYPKAVL